MSAPLSGSLLPLLAPMPADLDHSMPESVQRTILGIPGVGDLANAMAAAFGRVVSGAVHAFAAWAFSMLSDALLASSSVPLGQSFDAPWRAMLAVAALLALPIMLAGVAHEVLQGRPGQALRRGVAYPLAIGPVLLASRAVIGLLVSVVQYACGLLVQVGIGGPGGFAEGIDRMRATLGVATGPADPTGAGVSAVVVLIAGLLAVVIWIELAVRAALVLLLAAFVPLALAGMFWQATASWTRRLLECLAAVLLAPLVITMVMVLATATLTATPNGLGDGVNQIAIALALLFLGTFGLPMTFRLVPHVVEAAAVTGAGAMVARSARRHASNAARTATLAVGGGVAGGGAAGRLAAAPRPAPAAGAAGGSGSAPFGASGGTAASRQPARTSPGSPPAPSPAAAVVPTRRGGA
ncbi:MAG: hypothetical protein JWP39_18 [Jatrophihabitans sp.]|nr:hypothetical protein [Jatrophihabitans sp.]